MNSHRHNIKLVSLFYIWGLFISLFSFVGLILAYINKKEGTQLEEHYYKRLIKYFWTLEVPYFILSRMIIPVLVGLRLYPIDVSLHPLYTYIDVALWSAVAGAAFFFIAILVNTIRTLSRLPAKQSPSLVDEDMTKADPVKI